MAAITAPTQSRLPDGTLVYTLASTSCGTGDVIPIAVPGGHTPKVISMQLVASGGASTRIDPEWHTSDTLAAGTRVLSESWGSETPGLVYAAVASTPAGVPLPAVYADGVGTLYLRPQPSASGASVSLSLRIKP